MMSYIEITAVTLAAVNLLAYAATKLDKAAYKRACRKHIMDGYIHEWQEPFRSSWIRGMVLIIDLFTLLLGISYLFAEIIGLCLELKQRIL